MGIQDTLKTLPCAGMDEVGCREQPCCCWTWAWEMVWKADGLRVTVWASLWAGRGRSRDSTPLRYGHVQRGCPCLSAPTLPDASGNKEDRAVNGPVYLEMGLCQQRAFRCIFTLTDLPSPLPSRPPPPPKKKKNRKKRLSPFYTQAAILVINVSTIATHFKLEYI